MNKTKIDSLSLTKKEKEIDGLLDLSPEKPTGLDSKDNNNLRTFHQPDSELGQLRDDRISGGVNHEAPVFRPHGMYIGPDNPAFFSNPKQNHDIQPSNEWHPGMPGSAPGIGVKYDPIGPIQGGADREPNPDHMRPAIGPEEMFKRQQHARGQFPGVGGYMGPGYL